MESSSDLPLPTFYVCQHESAREIPYSLQLLQDAQATNYSMVSSPITTPSYKERVKQLLETHQEDLKLSMDSDIASSNPAPRIPHLRPSDVYLTPTNVSQSLIALTSSWIDLCSPNLTVSELSSQVLQMELAYASFCGVSSVIVRGPTFRSGSVPNQSTAQYANALMHALKLANYLHVYVWLPMAGLTVSDDEDESDLETSISVSQSFSERSPIDDGVADDFDSWDVWNIIRSTCKYSSRLGVMLTFPVKIPGLLIQDRWFAEPVRMLALPEKIFLKNAKGYPVLSKSHQQLIMRYMRMRPTPWLMLCDVGPIEPHDDNQSVDSSSHSIGEVGRNVIDKLGKLKSKKQKDPTPHLSYLRHLESTQPSHTAVERFGNGYQDYLQSPLQPLADNLESITYEVFEKDPVKYDWYEKAIFKALSEWKEGEIPGSGQDDKIVVAVVGAGRGPLVTRAIRASEQSGVAIQLFALEKNPNAQVVLHMHNQHSWNNSVTIVKSDMREWKGPPNGKVDILVSELLGSFGDNELSPECLDGVQHVLNPEDGISIPASYSSHIAPVLAPKLHAEIANRTPRDATAPETPYVVMLHAVDQLSTTIEKIWEFSHPQDPRILATHGATNTHNLRRARKSFECPRRGLIHGVAGYFETVLYDDVELSIRPDTIVEKSPDMISWFPIFFPIKTPLYVPDNSQIDVTMWRQTDGRIVWYEWIVETFAITETLGVKARTRLGASDLHSSEKNGCKL